MWKCNGLIEFIRWFPFTIIRTSQYLRSNLAYAILRKTFFVCIINDQLTSFSHYCLKKSIEVHFKIFLLYFYEAYDVSPWGKSTSSRITSRSTSCSTSCSNCSSCRTNFFIEFHHFMRKEWTQLKTKQLKQNIFKSVIGFCKLLY